jgi:hypothetical protein
VENGDLLLIYNSERIDIDDYVNPIKREAKMLNQQFKVTIPVFKYMMIKIHELEESINFIYPGSSHSRWFMSFFADISQPSGWIYFPEKYKFASFDFLIDYSKYKYSRSTYTFFDLLGDMGGMYDALYLIGLMIAAPAAEYNLRTLYLTRGFEMVGQSDPRLNKRVIIEQARKGDKKTNLLSHIQQNFTQRYKMEEPNLRSRLCCS